MILEVRDDDQTSVVMVYHFYHAAEEGTIHDWERVELRVDGVVGPPGNGEEINYVVITCKSSAYFGPEMGFAKRWFGCSS